MAIRGQVGRVLAAAALLAGVGFAVTAAQKAPAGKAGAAKAAATPFAAKRTALEEEMSKKRPAFDRERLRRGMEQVARFWRPADGDAKAFEEFVRANFADEQPALDALFARLETAFESLDGYMVEINRDFRMQTDLDRGPTYAIDETLAGYDPSAHVSDDFFGNKVAFIVLLNFPLTTLEQRLAEGESWTRRQWAEARLAQRFSKRIPAEVNLELARVSAQADQYIAEYNVWMHHVVDDRDVRLFPPKLRLLSHWNLRDQIKADYGDAALGLEKQRTIQKVMERIVTQTIPQAVIDNPHVDWNPTTNEVTASTVRDWDESAKPAPAKITNARESDTRYKMLLDTYRAVRKVDPYSPTAPTLIARRFEENRELPEARVRTMFEDVLTSPLVPRVAKLIEKRLGRPLEPFDVWYSGFKQRGKYTEAELDEIVRKKYPTAEAYEKDIPNLLRGLGFSKDKAEYVAKHVEVHPARGSGHAFGAGKRGFKAYLRTRVEKDGMNYKGYNIAVHEMGHNVEQTFSLYDIDHYLLSGVPNTAFTEALAFVFQGHDLELLGLVKPDALGRALEVLNDFWGTYEIAGVGLVDMAVWHWMYDHPKATPGELRDATIGIAKTIWNRYYAPVFGKKDVVLLGIYSHMIDSLLYLPDYPIGHMIAFQVERQMEKAGAIGPEFERMAKTGSVAPDLWMKKATGAPVGPEALLEAAAVALAQVEKASP
jgi:hypothetical protein